jgi:SecD/SecF fusion protein
MQNKVVIRLFAVAFALAALYELSFSFVAQRVEQQALESVGGDPSKLTAALDSMANQEVYNLGITSFTYKEVKEKEMNLGLDLRGGMNVILEVSVRDVLIGLSANPNDPLFVEALAAADAEQANSGEAYVDLFIKALDAKRGTRSWGDPGLFGTKDMSDRLGFNAKDDDIKSAIRSDVEASVQNVYTVLKARIDQFGVVQPNLQRLGNTGRILVELPGVKDPARVQRLLQSTARLEFWRADYGAAWMQFMVDANERLRAVVPDPNASKTAAAAKANPKAIDLPNAVDAAKEVTKPESTAVAATDSSALKHNPLLNIFQLNVDPQTFTPLEGPIIGFALPKDTATINGYLNSDVVKSLIPGDKRYVRFAWTRPDAKAGITFLIALQGNRTMEPELDGGVIVDARREFDQGNNPIVTMSMNGYGAQIWQRITAEESAKNPKGHVAVVLDNLVYSYPRVINEISGGRTQIEGGFSLDEATDLANVLKAGKLPVPARVIQADVVGPSLGKEAISSSVNSFIFAFLVVFAYMIFYYSGGGIAANIALLVNMFFIFGILDAISAVLTLPGMAGIVLTIGMAVDANVLIFDRIREELAAGKDVRTAVADGFANSRGAILDANATTLLTAIILFMVGTGPIKGFATTLIIGILSSLFTAIFVTRLYIEWRLAKTGTMSFATKTTKDWFNNTKFDFLKTRTAAYIISGSLVVVSIVALFTNGLSYGVDFEGGRTYQVRFDQPVEVSEVSAALAKEFVDEDGKSYAPIVKTLGTAEQVTITTNYRVSETGPAVEEELRDELFQGVKGFFVKVPSQESFNEPSASGMGIVAYRQVGPTVADDIANSAIWAILFSLLGIFMYLLVRFNRWQYSLGAVVALMHDVVLVLGAFALFDGILPFSMEVDQAFIAAILTVIGYSINDTVVVFDRIREYLADHKGAKADKGVINYALNSTLSRTFNTSWTTIIVLLVIFIFGGEVLRGFIFAILLGIVVGTYSSLFIASPILYDATPKEDKTK